MCFSPKNKYHVEKKKINKKGEEKEKESKSLSCPQLGKKKKANVGKQKLKKKKTIGGISIN